ncbi:hypothetical protein [Desulfobacter postgatei]|jgi:hypothetical protein|uniref:hypothetical protein n=1 Tax=Desulfobacter postgatei TaxID=2293 RepID=UPI002A36B310|nr:hypothetical protein [Desulfobacter postgatei]MDX9965167.1 hypothetical protein [Desulfobacter postgatei]
MMSDYLAKLKNQKQATGVLQKLQKGGKEANDGTAKTAKRPFYSKNSTQVGRFPEKNKLEQNQTPPPDLSKIQPGHTQEYITLWYQAWELADYVDGGNAVAPYADRVAGLPELNRVVERMRIIEGRLKPGTPSQTKKFPGIPAGWMPNPNHQDPDTCRACGENAWWRKNEPNSKWICGRCHPPAPGLDVIEKANGNYC